MKLDEAMELDEVKGKSGFDYLYWFWAKKDSTFGIGYARQPVELDIVRAEKEFKEAINKIKKSNVKNRLALANRANIKNVATVIASRVDDEEGKGELEFTDSKIKALNKRLKGIADYFGSPIVIHWLSSIREPTEELQPATEKPTIVTLPMKRNGDVTTPSGQDLNVVRLFRDENLNALKSANISRLRINDKEGDTQNTVIAKFCQDVAPDNITKKEIRKIGRGSGVANIMSTLKFKDTASGVSITPFGKADYALLPPEAKSPGGAKIASALRKMMKNNFARVLKRARSAF